MPFDSCRQRSALCWRSPWRDRRGVSSLELAVLGPVLVVMLLGTVDVGRTVQEMLLLRQAVRAGALYAVQWPTDTAGIAKAVTDALPSGMSATVGTPATSCACWSAAGGASPNPPTADQCGTACASGDTLQSFVTVTASASYSPLLLSSLTGPSASDVVRTQ